MAEATRSVLKPGRSSVLTLLMLALTTILCTVAWNAINDEGPKTPAPAPAPALATSQPPDVEPAQKADPPKAPSEPTATAPPPPNRGPDAELRAVAQRWADAKTAAKTQLPVLTWRAGSIGVIGSNLRVAQVIDGSTVLVDVLGQYDVSEFGALLFDVSTVNLADGQKFSAGDRLAFLCVGNQSYTTVLGAQRTVMAARAFRVADLEAESRVMAQEAERVRVAGLDAAIEVAQSLVLDAERQLSQDEAVLKKHREDGQLIEDYVQARDVLQLLGPIRDTNDETKAKVDAAEKSLKAIGPVTADEIERHRALSKDLLIVVTDSRRNLEARRQRLEELMKQK